jgi:hypothetical protein
MMLMRSSLRKIYSQDCGHQFNHGRHWEPITASLPSWIPDWTTPLNPFHTRLDGDYTTAYPVLKHGTSRVQDGTLFVRGQTPATVTMVAPEQVTTSCFRQSLESAAENRLSQRSESEWQCYFRPELERFFTFWIQNTNCKGWKQHETLAPDNPWLFAEVLVAYRKHGTSQRDVKLGFTLASFMPQIPLHAKMRLFVDAVPGALSQYMDAMSTSLKLPALDPILEGKTIYDSLVVPHSIWQCHNSFVIP